MSSVSGTTEQTSAAFKRRFNIRLVGVLMGGMFLDGYILGLIGPIQHVMTEELQIDAWMQGAITAAALFGLFIGSPLGGWASDKWGRKPLFLIDISLFVVASFVQFFVDSPIHLLLVRLVMGIAIGGEYSIGHPLMSEFAPAKIRGKLLVLTQVLWYVGFMMAFVIGYLLINFTDLNWRFILGTSTFIAVAVLLARLGLPESPRWLANQGRFDEARAIAVRYMEDADEVIPELGKEHGKKGSLATLFLPAYWRATLFVSVFWFCAVTPYFAIGTYAEPLMSQFIEDGLAGGVALSAVAALGTVAATLTIERLGRRTLTVPPQWICAILLATIALWAGAPSGVVLTLFLLYSFFNAIYNVLPTVYTCECFPTEARGIGTGFATSMSRIGATIGTFLFPMSMETLGTSMTILIAAGIALVGALVSQWLAPETKGKSLSETAAAMVH